MKKIGHEYVAAHISKREKDCNKGDFGRLLIIAGSRRMSGAAVIAAKSALRCGCGLTELASTESVIASVCASIPEALLLPLSQTKDGAISKQGIKDIKQSLEKATAVVIGCGLSLCKDTEKVVYYIIENSKVPIILDADGINIVSKNIDILKKASAPVIITPHLKEMSRLCGLSVEQIKQNKQKIAAEFAKEYSVTLVLKDYITIVASKDGEIYENTSGHPCMAKGGSGDMLSGMIGSFAAQKKDILESALCAVYLHGLCGELCASNISEHSVTASDMILKISDALLSLN